MISRTVLGFARNTLLPHKLGQGRPCGLLMSWLSVSRAENNATRDEHIHEVDPTVASDRRQGRDVLYTLEGGKAFANNCERALRTDIGETEEPDVIK